MAFAHKRFDVGKLKRRLDPTQLDWPKPGGAGSDATLGGNQQYQDLRLLDWAEARRVLDVEAEYIRRIEAAADPEVEIERVREEREQEWEEEDDPLYSLDLGVAGAVIALSAARCIPFSSCNGDAFGEGHYETHPLVMFHMRPQLVPIFLEAAIAAGVGLEGDVMLYSADVPSIVRFAEELYARRDQLDAIELETDDSGDQIDNDES